MCSKLALQADFITDKFMSGVVSKGDLKEFSICIQNQGFAVFISGDTVELGHSYSSGHY